jgi:hypothetical protein
VRSEIDVDNDIEPLWQHTWLSVASQEAQVSGGRGSGFVVSVSNPTEQQTIQRELDLPPQDPWRPGTDAGAARRAVDGSMDRIRSRFGGDAVGYLPVVMRNAGMVPDEFRELAEHDL